MVLICRALRGPRFPASKPPPSVHERACFQDEGGGATHFRKDSRREEARQERSQDGERVRKAECNLQPAEARRSDAGNESAFIDGFIYFCRLMTNRKRKKGSASLLSNCLQKKRIILGASASSFSLSLSSRRRFCTACIFIITVIIIIIRRSLQLQVYLSRLSELHIGSFLPLASII